MFCYKCGREIEEGDRFCTFCGADQGVVNSSYSTESATEQNADEAAGDASPEATTSAPADTSSSADAACAEEASDSDTAKDDGDVEASSDGDDNVEDGSSHDGDKEVDDSGRTGSDSGAAANDDGGAEASGDTAKFGPYELRDELGRGAMAVVWRAWDPNLDREVAIKEPIIDASFPPAVRDEMARRFVIEAKTAAGLNHPNIVSIYAADVYDGRAAIVMELVEGTTLSGLLERGPLAPAVALDALDQLLDAVGYAHERGIVHRDIKPDNVFVNSEGRIKLADFGIARAGDARTTMTMAGAVLGTPGYMSPEQARGTEVDGRSDLFSVGIIGYEMLAGRNPFGVGGDPTTLLYRVVHEPVPELPTSASEGLPADLRPAIMAALAKDPADRPQTAASFKAALHGGALPSSGATTSAGLAAGAAQASSIRRLPSWLPYAAVGGACAIAVIVALVFATNGGGGTTSVPSASTTATDGTASTTSSAEAYLAVHDDKVAIYTTDSATPYKVTDVQVSDLPDEEAAKLDQHIACTSVDEATKKVEQYKADIERTKKEEEERNAGNYPPVFTQTDCSSYLPPDQYVDYYGPDLAVDGDTSTAWNEASDVGGPGEWIALSADEKQKVSKVSIMGGYCKSESLYWKNNRPKDITISYDGGSEHFVMDDTFGTFQTFTLSEPVATTEIKITIVSIYERGEYNDCCISEITVE